MAGVQLRLSHPAGTWLSVHPNQSGNSEYQSLAALWLACAGYLVHPFRTRDFEKRETKEKRGGNGKRERACFLGEGCRVAVRKCSRSSLRGARHGTSVGA